MARAHLPVDVELASAFLQAQSQDSKVAWIACTIKGEAVCLIKAHEDATSTTLSDTVDSLQASVPLSDEQPCFVLIARERTPTARRWQLLNWAPDCAPPRLKMLYSSSFVDKATYDAVYGTLDPAMRAKVDPKGTRPSVFEKTAHPSVLDAGADLVLGY